MVVSHDGIGYASGKGGWWASGTTVSIRVEKRMSVDYG